MLAKALQGKADKAGSPTEALRLVSQVGVVGKRRYQNSPQKGWFPTSGSLLCRGDGSEGEPPQKKNLAPARRRFGTNQINFPAESLYLYMSQSSLRFAWERKERAHSHCSDSPWWATDNWGGGALVWTSPGAGESGKSGREILDRVAKTPTVAGFQQLCEAGEPARQGQVYYFYHY